MHADAPNGTSKKRKFSSLAEEDPERDRTASIIRRSITLLTADPHIPATSLHPLLNALTEAYGSALSDSASTTIHPVPLEDWDWELSTEQIMGLSEEEITIWKDLLPCRHSLRLSGIKLHPHNWRMPVVDLKQWVAHIPGNKGVGASSTDSSVAYRLYRHLGKEAYIPLQVIFSPGSPEGVPKLRFSPPLFHPNVYPSGTWGGCKLPENNLVNFRDGVWLKTKQEDPERFAKVLRSIQVLLHEPDIAHPAQSDAYTMVKNDTQAYEKKIREQAEAWTPDPRTGLAGRPIYSIRSS
ncbi:SUMO-conjugating enzyme ubc9 [Mycena venus]|uniref:SUMO-conjugating enzyme ubc9 n=1 Tax=Mycena venus TaxID=2733690 RepID=A0A8H6Y9B7_9AGAR|nr:SUMO-conjugating enzyme ubc9 [Mycena venus]